MMTLRYTDATLRETELDVPPRRIFDSTQALREYLCRLACQYWRGPEGRTWAIAQAPRGSLIPLYAVNRQTGDTLTIA